MKILGISYAHDSGACIIDSGRILSSINEERLAKIKMKGGPPLLSIREAMRIAGVGPEDIDVVAFLKDLDALSIGNFIVART